MKPLLYWDQTVEPFWFDLLVIEKAGLLGGIVDESDDLNEIWYTFTNQEKLDIYNRCHDTRYTLRDFVETRED